MTDTSRSDLVRALFTETAQADFDFSQLPDLVTARRAVDEHLVAAGSQAVHTWQVVQAGFLQRATHGEKYPGARLRRLRALDTRLFARLGALRGTVLDVGGGWGLYREYWQPEPDSAFIVHDPGITRFLSGAHPTHYEWYQRAFRLPMTFVEGVGESLPYRDGAFDTALVAATLDHCADPRLVLAEVSRVLRGGGRIVVVQHCSYAQWWRRSLHGLARLAARLVRAGLTWRRRPPAPSATPVHMFHFSFAQVAGLLEGAGFHQIRGFPIEGARHVFQAWKPPAQPAPPTSSVEAGIASGGPRDATPLGEDEFTLTKTE